MHPLILSLCQRKKKFQYEGNGYLQKICRSCKKNGQVRPKGNPKLLQGFISPVHFVVATIVDLTFRILTCRFLLAVVPRT